MVMIGATKFRSPIQITPTATAVVSRTAVRGSVGLPRRPARNSGTTRSEARACRVRGAARMLPRADESVAAKTPAMISQGQREMVAMIVPSSRRCSRLAWVANHQTASR